MRLLGADKSHNKIVRMAILNTLLSECTRLCIYKYVAARRQVVSVFAYFQMQNENNGNAEVNALHKTQSFLVVVPLLHSSLPSSSRAPE